jgi:hypothetical protein
MMLLNDFRVKKIRHRSENNFFLLGRTVSMSPSGPWVACDRLSERYA